MKKARLIPVLIAALVVEIGAAKAGTITAANTAGWATNSVVKGTGFSANSTVYVQFRDSSGNVIMGTYTADNSGNLDGGLPNGVTKGERVFYSGTEANGTTDKSKPGGVVASANQLPTGGSAIGVYIVDAGSTLDAGSQVYSLTGDFASIETNYDNDSTSPTYADLSFSLQASDFHVHSNSGGPLTLSLAADDSFALNLLPFLAALDAGNFTSSTLPVSFPADFLLTVGGVSYAANGTVSGFMTTTVGDLSDPVTFDLNLTSGLGPITGNLVITASFMVTPEPEPVLLLLAGLALLARFRARSAWSR